jgi:hypothetical protein
MTTGEAAYQAGHALLRPSKAVSVQIAAVDFRGHQVELTWNSSSWSCFS